MCATQKKIQMEMVSLITFLTMMTESHYQDSIILFPVHEENFANKEASFSLGRSNTWLNGFATISSPEPGMSVESRQHATWVTAFKWCATKELKNTVFIIVIPIADPDWQGGGKSYYHMAGGMHGRGNMHGRGWMQERWPLKRGVHILLECIFVLKWKLLKKKVFYTFYRFCRFYRIQIGKTQLSITLNRADNPHMKSRLCLFIPPSPVTIKMSTLWEM